MEEKTKSLLVPAAGWDDFFPDELLDWIKQSSEESQISHGVVREPAAGYAGAASRDNGQAPTHELAEQKRIATELARQVFPANTLDLVSVAPDISGGYHFSFRTSRQQTGYPPLKPAVRLPRPVNKLSEFTISFDPDQQRVKLAFGKLGTLKSYFYRELDFQPQSIPTGGQQRFQEGRHDASSSQGTPYIAGQQGQAAGEEPDDLAGPHEAENSTAPARENGPKTGAEIKQETNRIIGQHRQQLQNTPQHVFAVHKETGDIKVFARDARQRPVMKTPQQVQRQNWYKEPPLLVIIPHKGFLSNFIINFKNQFDFPALEVLAAPASLPVEKAAELIRENLPLVQVGTPETLTALNRNTGISAVTDPVERAFIHLPEEEQQKVLRRMASDPEMGKARPVEQPDGRFRLAEEPLPKTSFLQDLKNFIALLNDQDPVYSQDTATGAGQQMAIADYIDRLDMQEHKFDPDKINWKDAEKLGLTRELLEKTGNLQRLLEGEKTTLLEGLRGDLGGVKISVDGKFRLVQGPGGYPTFVFHGVRSRLDIPQEFLGYQFSEEDKQQLKEAGNLSKKVFLIDKATRQGFAAYIGVDRETNEIVAIRAERIRIPEAIKGVTLSEQQRKTLEEGKPVVIAGMRDEQNREFSATVQIDPGKKGLSFKSLPGTAVQQAMKTEDKIQAVEKGSLVIPNPDEKPQAPEPENHPGQEKRRGPRLS